MGHCASKKSGKRTIDLPLNRTDEPVNTEEDDHHYDDVNYDMMYEEINANQIVGKIPVGIASSSGHADTLAFIMPPYHNNVPVGASSSTGQMSDTSYNIPPVCASCGDSNSNDGSYDDAFSCPIMPRVNFHSEVVSDELSSGTDSHGYRRNGTESASSHLSVNSHSERGSMEACSEPYSRSSTYSSYNDSRIRDNIGQILASKGIYTSLRSLVSVGEAYQMLCYDLETMVEIFRDEIEEDVDARRVVIYLTFLPSSYEREINQTFRESPKKSIKMLIDKIKDVRESGKWETFVIALEHAGYENIAKNLRGVLQEDNRDKLTIVRVFAPTLVNQINPLEITPLLYSRNIISLSDKEEIERENYNFGMIAAARRLLRCLHHKCSSWFEQFCDVLKECEYSDLAEMLNPKTTHLDSQDTETLSSGDIACFQSSEQRPARLIPKRQYENIEEELQKSIRELQLCIDDLETNDGGHIGQGQHSRGEEYKNSQLNTTVNPELMADNRTIIEDIPTEISNKCQQSLEQTLRQIFIPECRSIMEEILSRNFETFRDEIRKEIRSIWDDVSRESRSRAWVYKSSDYRLSSSGYASGNTSVYEPIQEADEELSPIEQKEIYEDSHNSHIDDVISSDINMTDIGY